MNARNKRCRTGCLTCRSRRVKCDEGKPNCDRCLAANIECLGYEPKRPARARQVPDNLPRQNVSASTSGALLSIASTVLPCRPDHLPLVGFPVNPNPFQRPHMRARDVLGYSQYLCRTSVVLFSQHDLFFWRDFVCEESFESEVLFDAIVCLGTLHRALLLKSMPNENDQNRGLDTQVVAVQAYVQTLQRLADEFTNISERLDLLSTILLLLAYFECFLGNIPATLRHARTANLYYEKFGSTSSGKGHFSFKPLRHSLEGFSRIYQLILPESDLVISDASKVASLHIDSPSNEVSIDNMVQDLLCLSSSDAKMQSLIWSPFNPYSSPTPVSLIKEFQATLQSWKNANAGLASLENAHPPPTVSSHLSWMALENLVLPPKECGVGISYKACFAAALYNFLMARTSWALSIAGENSEMNELATYFFVYETMRWSFSICGDLENVGGRPDMCLPCESLTTSLIPLLYGIGTCCPSANWLQCIIQHLEQVGQTGLLRGDLLARCLSTMYLFELHTRTDSSSLFNRLPPPASRIIVALLPDTDGGGYSAFYARRGLDEEIGCHDTSDYHAIGQARWEACTQAQTTKPNSIEFFSDPLMPNTPFDKWLLNQKRAEDWRNWDRRAEFNLELATRDHIYGSRLAFDADNDAISR